MCLAQVGIFMSSMIVPYLAKVIMSQRLLDLKRWLAEKKRKRQKQPHILTVYICINDPYSYLLLQTLPSLIQRFDLQIDFRTVLNKQKNMFPAPKLWDTNALNDGHYLAQLYDLDFPKNNKKSPAQLDEQLTAQLLHWELQPGFLDHALVLFKAYWQGEYESLLELTNPSVVQHAECYEQHLLANETLLKNNGHYLSAMVSYAGEWYWGLDRLQYLERRLNDLGLNHHSEREIKYNLAQKNFCQRLSPQVIQKAKELGVNKNAIEMYWSIRSPYSYLGLVRARKLADYYQVPLIVKPVLPMVMRRMSVPNTKKYYISQDAKREAIQHNIEFGFIADPLGKGVERCYALYEFAQSQGKGIEYLESYALGVWSEGIRSDTDQGLQKIMHRVGLNWDDAKEHLQDESWKLWAQKNLAELYGNDLWGVPTFKYRHVKTFGQDRIDLIEREIASYFQQATD